MTGTAEAAAIKLAKQSGSATRVQQGTCKTMDWASGRAIINISGGEVPVPVVGVAPIPGRQVWVLYVGDAAVCLGMLPRAAMGLVTGVAAAGRVPVKGDDLVNYVLPYLGTAPGNATRVALDWDSGGHVAGVMSAEPEGSEYIPPATAPPTGQTRSITFNPIDSGSYSNSGSWFDTAVASDSSSRGAYFYGTQVRDSIPAGAVVTGAGFLAAFEVARYEGVQLGASALGSKSGPPTWATPGVGIGLDSGWKDVISLVPALRGAGQSIATGNNGFSRLARAGVANAGALHITFRT